MSNPLDGKAALVTGGSRGIGAAIARRLARDGAAVALTFASSHCGSPVYSRRDSEPELLRRRLGLLDGDPGRRPAAHVWVGSKAPWYEITDALPQFDEGVPPGVTFR